MDDHHLEQIIGNLLRAGVLLAAAVVLAGGGLYLVQDHADKTSFHTFVTEHQDLRHVAGIVRSAAHLNSEGLIQFGLLLLIATPVARVILAGIGFVMEKDRMYSVVCLIVLAVLVFSLLHAT